MSATTPQNHPSFEELFKDVDTVPLALFEHLDLSFLEEFPVFAPDPWGRTRKHKPADLFKGILYCFSRDIYGVKEVNRELQDELVWRQCGFDSAPSHQSIHRFFIDFSLVAEDAFGKLVEQVADRDLLDNTFRIDSTDVRADPADDEATWNYDPTADSDDNEDDEEGEQSEDDDAEEYDEDEPDEEDDGGFYYGYGCLIVSTGPKLPIAAAFTQRKQVDQETARRVTRDALAIEKPMWMIGDAAFDMLDWHDDCIEENVLPIAPYNPRNTDDPLDIEFRIEDQIEEHGDEIQLKQSVLKETYNRRTQVERTIGAGKDCGLGTPRVRGRVRVKSHVFLALCLRLAIAIANYERGANPGKTSVEV
jgi:hypothetical protein